MNTVAVVGAGITGLTAAFRLKQQGVPVVVYEASSRAGGVIQTTRRDDFLVEQGPNTIMNNSPEIGELVKDLGLEEACAAPAEASVRYIVRDRKMIRLPGSAWEAITTPMLSTGAKLRVFAEPFISRSTEADESLASFVRRRVGQEFLDYLINPFVSGVYAGNPEKLSVEQAFPKLFRLEEHYGSLIKGAIFGAKERRERPAPSKAIPAMFSFAEGLGVLPKTIAAKLGGAVRLNCAVRGLIHNDDGWMVYSERGKEEHSSVLFCAPAHNIAPIAGAFQGLQRISYPPIARVGFGFRRDQVAHSLVGFGGLIPEIERMNTLGVLFSSSMFPNRAPSGHVLLTAFAGGTRNPEVAGAEPDEIARLCLDDVRQLLGVTGDPVFQDVFQVPKAIPQYEVGYAAFKAMAANIEQSMPGVFLAGNYRDGISVVDCVKGGDAAAQRVGTYLDKACLAMASCS
jgi:oxygen-dependent protoporphyrinogen oxidase